MKRFTFKPQFQKRPYGIGIFNNCPFGKATIMLKMPNELPYNPIRWPNRVFLRWDLDLVSSLQVLQETSKYAATFAIRGTYFYAGANKLINVPLHHPRYHNVLSRKPFTESLKQWNVTSNCQG